ncbi:MAG: hypothetical protein RL431_721 [Actinomycetota bacterium]
MQNNGISDGNNPERVGPMSTPIADELMDLSRRRVALRDKTAPLPTTTRVIAVSNQKGGVGKTTSTVNLAAALADLGAKVIVIDLDPQGNASTALGIEHNATIQGTYETLHGAKTLGSVLRQSQQHPNLWCAPATINLAGAEIELVPQGNREFRLRDAIAEYIASSTQPPHYIFIDCPPSLGLLTINALVAAGEVLVPIQAEYYALEGVTMLWNNIAMVAQSLNPHVHISTILLTMVDARTNLSREVEAEVRSHFPTQVLTAVIPRSVRVSEAPSHQQTVIGYDNNSSGALSYREAAIEMAERAAASAPHSTGADDTGHESHEN